MSSNSSAIPPEYLQRVFAQRIGGRRYGQGTEIYKFERIKRAKRRALEQHPGGWLLDLGVGEPDEMAFPEVVQRLCEEARKPENRGYADNGDDVLKEAAARYMERVFGVPGIKPKTEVIHSIGSKAALSILPAALVDPGDVVFMTVPGYPVFGTHARYYGGTVYPLLLCEENGFLPDLEAIPNDVAERAKVLVLNYPNNPTGASATPEFFERAVHFARKHGLVLIHDAAYSALVFDGAKPLSLLSIPGAKEISLELHSCSKSFNMTGWRIGFVTGNEWLVRAYGDVKDNTDSGQFLAIQHAAAYCLDHPELTEQIAAKYSRRMDGLVQVLRQAGFKAQKPKGSFFLYTRAPSGVVDAEGREIRFQNAEEAAQWLITELLICTVPWDDAGPYLRFSVTFEAPGEEAEKRFLEELRRRLQSVRLLFD